MTATRCRVGRKRVLGRATCEERAAEGLRVRSVQPMTSPASTGCEAAGADVARAHDRSPFRARGKGRDRGEGGWVNVWSLGALSRSRALKLFIE